MNLKHLSDKELLKATKFLVKEENKLKTKVLYHLKEIESRRLFTELGYSSLFNYVVRELGYSESAAHRRIQASRMLFEIPKLAEKIENGNLTLGNISQASKFFSDNKIAKREVKQKILAKLENKSRSEGEKELFELSGKRYKPRVEKVRRSSATTHELKFTVSDETMAMLDELKGLLAHRGKRSLAEVFEFALKTTSAQLKKERFKLAPAAKRRSKVTSHSRYIPAGVRRKVYERDSGKCVNCGTNYKLEFDHIKPFAVGGKSSENNLRLLCFSCNQRQAIKAGLVRTP